MIQHENKTQPQQHHGKASTRATKNLVYQVKGGESHQIQSKSSSQLRLDLKMQCAYLRSRYGCSTNGGARHPSATDRRKDPLQTHMTIRHDNPVIMKNQHEPLHFFFSSQYDTTLLRHYLPITTAHRHIYGTKTRGYL